MLTEMTRYLTLKRGEKLNQRAPVENQNTLIA